MQFVVIVNGLLLVALGLAMGALCLLGGATAAPFAEAAALTLLAGGGLVLCTRNRMTEMHRLHAFVLTSSIWLTGAAAGALPLWLWGLSPVDAFFEAMSGITTTGSTVMTGLDETPAPILLWRAVLQWIGGVGFIVAGIAVLPILRVGGMQLFRTESSEQGEKELGSATRFASATIWIYTLLTALCFLAYRSGGMTPFDALAHALTTLSSGGYSSHDSSFGYFQSPFLQWAGTFFMIGGALPFAWYIRVLYKGRIASEQVSAFVLSLLVAILGLSIWRMLTSDSSLEEALRLVAFNVVSVVTTTGYATTDYTTWGPAAVTAFFILTAMGGCTGSTAGGAKMMRWIVVARVTAAQALRLRNPHGIFPLRYEGRALEPDVVSGVITFFILYAGTVLVLAVLLTWLGLDLQTALSGSLTAVANVGPGVGEVIGPAGTFAPLPDTAKLLLSFGMYVGRLEMATVFVLMLPIFWREVAARSPG